MGIFSSKSSSPAKKSKYFKEEPKHNNDISEVDKAKLALRRVRAKMSKMEKAYQAETEELTGKIKAEMRAGRKDRARMFLRLRKLREAALSRTVDQLVNVEKQIMTLQEQQQNIEYVQSLEVANKAMEELQKIMPIDYVEDLLERNQELRDINAEISDLIAGDGLCSGALLDEEDVLQELESLEAEVSQNGESSGISVQDAMDLPVAPSDELITKPSGDNEDVTVSEEKEGRVLIAA